VTDQYSSFDSVCIA